MIQYTRYYANGMSRRAPVADGTSFDGNLFSDLNIVVERITDPLPDMRENLVENNGRHGSSVRSLHMSPRNISLECRLFTGRVTVQNENGHMSDWYDYDGVLQDLGEFLYTPDDRRLVLRNHPGQYYMAHFTSMDEGDRDDQSAGFTLNFTASDPLRYEENERSLVVESSTAMDFEVGGTDESKLTMEMRNCSGSVGIRLSGYAGSSGDYMIRAIKSGSMVSFDCVNHIVRVDGSVSGITLDSKWPILTPGRWTARPSGGKLTMNWRQSYR